VVRLEEHRNQSGDAGGWKMAAAVLVATLFLLTAVGVAQGQTFTVIHNFNGTGGAQPYSGITRDASGNFYGTTDYGGRQNCDNGGPPGCGVAYKLRQVNSEWLFTVLYEFLGSHNDFLPTDPGNITIAPNGVPFGTQFLAGPTESGLLYSLQPPPNGAIAANTPWSYRVDHSFGGGNDGSGPSQVTIDSAGNIFGTTGNGGTDNAGIVYELTPSNGSWVETILYNFTGGADGDDPDGVSLDASGNIFGVTRDGGSEKYGTIYELTPSGSGWIITVLHDFADDAVGGISGPLLRDSAGNLYGVTAESTSDGGTIWELSPSDGGWVFNVLYSLPGPPNMVSLVFRLVMDAGGALYGVNNIFGANNLGSAFKLAPSNGGWAYTDLHDFGSLPNDADGCYPRGPVALDGAGNIYGTTQQCGKGAGVIYQIAP
jgi:hypothetical protein